MLALPLVVLIGLLIALAGSQGGASAIGIPIFALAVGPAFVTVILSRIIGVLMLERRADKKWSGQHDYQAYKENIPALISFPWS